MVDVTLLQIFGIFLVLCPEPHEVLGILRIEQERSVNWGYLGYLGYFLHDLKEWC